MTKHFAYDPAEPDKFQREPGEIVTLTWRAERKTNGWFKAGDKVRFVRYTRADGQPVVQELDSDDPEDIWYFAPEDIEGGA